MTARCMRIAQKFGGGGHVKAAGCTISVPIAKAKEMVLAEVEKCCKKEFKEVLFFGRYFQYLQRKGIHLP